MCNQCNCSWIEVSDVEKSRTTSQRCRGNMCFFRMGALSRHPPIPAQNEAREQLSWLDPTRSNSKPLTRSANIHLDISGFPLAGISLHVVYICLPCAGGISTLKLPATLMSKLEKQGVGRRTLIHCQRKPTEFLTHGRVRNTLTIVNVN